MKKIITFIAALLILLSAAGCNRGYSSNYMAMGLVESNPSGTAFMSFMTFSGTKVLTLNSSAEGYIKYSAHLTEGSVTVYYDGGEGKTELFSVGEGGSLESSGGHIGNGTVYIIVEAEGSCRDGYLRFEAAAGEPAENGDDEMKKEIDADTYVWEKEGAGGNFAISLFKNGTYSYYEGFFSSYIGAGNWTVEDGVLTLTETGGYDFVFRFRMEDDALYYIKEGSDKFIYTEVEDGDRFGLDPDYKGTVLISAE